MLNIVYPYDQSGEPNVLPINTPVAEQIEAIRERHRSAGVVGVVTYPTNGAMLARLVMEKKVDMSFIATATESRSWNCHQH